MDFWWLSLIGGLFLLTLGLIELCVRIGRRS
jgi:hypothetical protein